jgi:hypothetical protein
MKNKILYALGLLAGAALMGYIGALLWSVFIEPAYLKNLADSIPCISSVMCK